MTRNENDWDDGIEHLLNKMLEISRDNLSSPITKRNILSLKIAHVQPWKHKLRHLARARKYKIYCSIECEEDDNHFIRITRPSAAIINFIVANSISASAASSYYYREIRTKQKCLSIIKEIGDMLRLPLIGTKDSWYPSESMPPFEALILRRAPNGIFSRWRFQGQWMRRL